MLKQFQHGDVLGIRVDELPAGCKHIQPRNGRYILADGEVTGHAHAIAVADGIKLYEASDGTIYLRTEVEAPLTHEEHHRQIITPGIYEIGRVVEVDPFEGEIRKVMD